PSRRSSAVCEREWRARPVRGLKAPETFRRLQPRARLHCRPSRNALPPERARSGLWRCDRSTIEAPYGCRDGSFLRQKRAFSNEARHQAGKRASGAIVCPAERSAKGIRSQGCAKGAPPSARAHRENGSRETLERRLLFPVKAELFPCYGQKSSLFRGKQENSNSQAVG